MYIFFRQCGGVLFDEEIMAGWSPEDSNLNTVCAWCQQRTVPTISIQVLVLILQFAYSFGPWTGTCLY